MSATCTSKPLFSESFSVKSVVAFLTAGIASSMTFKSTVRTVARTSLSACCASYYKVFTSTSFLVRFSSTVSPKSSAACRIYQRSLRKSRFVSSRSSQLILLNYHVIFMGSSHTLSN